MWELPQLLEKENLEPSGVHSAMCIPPSAHSNLSSLCLGPLLAAVLFPCLD